jgi:hypothetical protein
MADNRNLLQEYNIAAFKSLTGGSTKDKAPVHQY